MNRFGIGILFYNELENASKILDDIRMSDLSHIDFYFLDNGSKNIDFTKWLLSIDHENVKVFQVDQNLGFGGGAKFLLQNIPNEFKGNLSKLFMFII